MSDTLVLVALILGGVISVLVGTFSLWRRETAVEAGTAEISMPSSVAGFVDAVHRCALEVDDRYVFALGVLRHDPEGAARHIETAYRAAGPERLGPRQALLLAASALRHRAILPFLFDVARQPVTGDIRHDGGRAAEESALRLVAVDGIEAIARAGDINAADTLLALTSSTDRSVQAAAVVALKYSDLYREHFERLHTLLPADRLHLLDVRRATVQDVPQVSNPLRHLRDPPTTSDARPDPDSGERRNGPHSRKAGIPQATGER